MKAKPILIVKYRHRLTREQLSILREILEKELGEVGWTPIIFDGMDENNVIALYPENMGGSDVPPEMVERIISALEKDNKP